MPVREIPPDVYSVVLAGAVRLRSLASRPLGCLSVGMLFDSTLNPLTRAVRSMVGLGHVTPPPGSSSRTVDSFRDSAITQLADDRLQASFIVLVMFPTDTNGRTGLLDPNNGARGPERLSRRASVTG